MKKAVSILLCFAFILCLLACSDSNEAQPTLPDEYETILRNIINAYPWNDDDLTLVPEHPELSYMYRRNTALSEIGFALIDLDDNGQKELLLSDVNKPFVYDVYTIIDGEAIHIFDSHERNSYYLLENGYVENQWSGSAAVSGHDYYKFVDCSLTFVERITMDPYHALDAGLIGELSEANDANSFFTSATDQSEDYRHIAFDDALSRIDAYQNENPQLSIDYTLLSEYQNSAP